MTSKLHRLVVLVVCFLASVVGLLPHPAVALDTPNVLMGIDGMVLHASGLFRDPSTVSGAVSDDGSNTFVYQALSHYAGNLGRYKSAYLMDNNVDPNSPTQNFGGISHNARARVDTPQLFAGSEFTEIVPFDLDSDFFSVIDRGNFGQVFDPAEYQIEVKFKPVLAANAFPIKNEAHTFIVGLEQMDGFVWDAEAGRYKRAGEQIQYPIGTEAVGINDWYNNPATVKDADGFATWVVPLNAANADISRSHYFDFGQGGFRTANVVPGSGRVQNPTTLVWSDVTDGLDPLSFGGGATDPSRPGSQLRVPNGVPFIQLQSFIDLDTNVLLPDETRVLSIEFKSATLKRKVLNNIMARIDANSGLTFRFGDSLRYASVNEANGTTPPPPTPINVPGATTFVPDFTNQISRFDQNGMTNLIIQPRTAPDPNNSGYRFFMRGAPTENVFDGTNAKVEIRAKLTQPLTDPGVAQNMTIYAKDLDGSDNSAPINQVPGITVAADPVGADEYSFNLSLTSTATPGQVGTLDTDPAGGFEMRTITVPLSAFNVNTMATAFANPGDGSRTQFNLYEFGAQVANGGGLLRLEVEYMQLILPPAADADFNDSGIVEGHDFLTWQRAFGGPGTPTTGDASGDGQVNTTDFDIWKSKFGGPPATTAAGNGVPEPTAAALAAVALAAAVAARRRGFVV